MLKNYNHDLIQQLSEISDSLWRIEDYIKNSEGCDSCANMWREMKEDYEKHVEMLKGEIAKHVKEDKFN
ncbi:MAG: hypothetical protein PHS16_00240 [Candidatus Colwellbacteria bacterium]|nr:hypothetical protein [Candidatus Colwellbacteria bacterium]MDD4818666.1 hypothetical protein [Candidatus Colwellbacteria bacterium]